MATCDCSPADNWTCGNCRAEKHAKRIAELEGKLAALKQAVRDVEDKEVDNLDHEYNVVVDATLWNKLAALVEESNAPYESAEHKKGYLAALDDIEALTVENSRGQSCIPEDAPDTLRKELGSHEDH
jgi:hypothetical protein